MKTKLIAVTFALLTLLLGGCTTTQTPQPRYVDLQNFLFDDQTTKEEVLLQLGEPSARFQSEKVLTYRLGKEDRNRGHYVVAREVNPQAWPTWVHAKSSLVLVFDAQGILRQHALVEVN